MCIRQEFVVQGLVQKCHKNIQDEVETHMTQAKNVMVKDSI